MNRSFKNLASPCVLIVFMLGLTLGLGLFLHRTMRQKLNSHFSEHQSTLDTAYRASIQMYRLAIESFYINVIARPEILDLLDAAVNTQGEQQDLARGRLYRQLFPSYRAIKTEIPLQIQFYLPDGTSLLRFHKPDRHGDPLLDFQNSIRLVNKYKRPVHGFETGKVRSGFRHVYPISYKGRYLGSFDASVTAKGIRDALAELDPNREYVFLLHRKLTEPHIFAEQQWLYSTADLHPDFLLEDANAILPDSPPPISAMASLLNRQLHDDPDVQAAMDQGRPITTCADAKGIRHMISLLPIRNIRGHVAGYLVSYVKDPAHKAIFQEYVVYLASMLTVSLLMTVLLLRLRRWAFALSAEKRNLQAMGDALAEGLYVTNDAGIIERINPAACKILGYSEAEMLGQTAHDLLHCHDENNFQSKEDCPFFQATSQGESYDGEEKFRDKSGAMRIVKVASRPVRADGEFLGAVTAFHDITLRKETEERLRRSEETARKLSTAVEQSPTAVLITDPNGIIEYANPRFLNMTGFDQSEVIGAKPSLVKSGQMPEEFYKELWAEITAGRTWKGEFLNRRKNGELYWEMCAISPVRDPLNVITNFIAIKEDISERKRMEEALREKERIQAALIESLPVPLVIIDAETRIIENVNPAAADLIGAEEDQIIGHICHHFLCPTDKNCCPILDLGKEVDNSERVLLQPDGTEVPVLKTVKRITVRGQEKLIECMMDIRGRLETEEALRKANWELQEATAKAEQLAKKAEQAPPRN